MSLTIEPLNVDLRFLKVLSDNKTKKIESLDILKNLNINVFLIKV